MTAASGMMSAIHLCYISNTTDYPIRGAVWFRKSLWLWVLWNTSLWHLCV